MTTSIPDHHDDEDKSLHVLFFPLMAKGHMIPTLDMAKMLSERGVKSTIVTTPLNAPLFRAEAKNITVVTIPFPADQAGLPAGIESLDAVSEQPHHAKFFLALSLLEPAIETVLAELKPDALVADVFFHWAPSLAASHGVTSLSFHGTSFVSMCCMDSLETHKPYELVHDDDDPFVLPNLPHRFELTRSQIPETTWLGIHNDFTRMLEKATSAAKTSHGMIVNTFLELEPAFADHYRNSLGRKAWHIGPVSLCNTKMGSDSDSDSDSDCLKWLDSKKSRPGSVVYVCFGTNVRFSAEQLREIAFGLEDSGQDFLWVVAEKGCGEFLPKGFEERTRERGVIVRGWAPQVRVLGHRAVGGFVTHCGWNSVLEGVAAGVPMVTWPIFAEQFYNEKLVVQVLGTGVAVGARKWARFTGDFVGREKVNRAVKELMAGEGSDEMRIRAEALGEAARMAVKEGGSSYEDLGNLIQELKFIKKKNQLVS